jgi:hypothetical protein
MNLFRGSFGAKFAHRRLDMAHSPLAKAIYNTEERRSQLFPDRRRIPSRKAKFVILFAILCQVWGVKKVIEIRKHFGYGSIIDDLNILL